MRMNRKPFIHTSDKLETDFYDLDGDHYGFINYVGNSEGVMIFTETSDEFKPYAGHAGTFMVDGVEEPRIILDEAAYSSSRAGEDIGLEILYHEFGHLEHGDLDDGLLSDLSRELRDIANLRGCLYKTEFLANCIAARMMGRERACAALMEQLA